VPTGEVWPRDAIAERKRTIEAAGLTWAVVESLPVHSAIRLREPGFERYVHNYEQSLEHLGEADVRTVCYNFIPVVDWTRTDLDHLAADGSRGLRFDSTDFAAFDLFILARPGAGRDYSDAQRDAARRRFDAMDAAARDRLLGNIIVGVPGESGQSLDGLRAELARFADVGAEQLRSNWVAFLRAIIPLCERHDIKMCVHPDDPPRPILGLPRIASRQSDFEALFDAVPSRCNGLTLCFGSLGAGKHNDLGAIAERFAERVHFTHLRSVHVEQDDSFVETDHLGGDADLVEFMRVLVHEERRRRAAGDATPIALRPDHGRVLEGDIVGWPGYPWLGRLKALAELRGVLRAVERLT
jgi:mannonate dehydratase